ncbi:undecaprenyl/decaprenyl-phosphate alpha-N-acetylglucosaminyl 1-phosphate transferase [Patescibacteria group bacterium]|nr:undecaprenyl/decaprenyl-phosphate alpha-N-acetylglucosaminyl 1-phosphate transferase [Patescibacteria group bacterium]
MVIKLILLPLFLSALISFLATLPTIKLARKFGLVTDAKKRSHPAHTHTGIIPRAGGLPVYLGVLFSSLILLPVDQHLRGILIGGGLLTIIGLLDDKYDLNPNLRLITCLLAGGVVVGAGIGIPFINHPFQSGFIRLDQPQIIFTLLGQPRSIWIVADTLALIWILWMTNIVNWVKGFDGQLPGIVTIAALVIAILTLKFSADITEWPVAILASITAGAFLGFLPFNAFPQKIMPGYGGGSLAGFLLAILAILSTTKVGTTIVVLGIPIMDAVYTILRRLSKGHSPVWGDRGHLHHRLLDSGWSKPKTALFYWLSTAVLGSIALNLNSLGKFYTIVILFLITGGFLLWLRFFSTLSSRPGLNKPSKT